MKKLFLVITLIVLLSLIVSGEEIGKYTLTGENLELLEEGNTIKIDAKEETTISWESGEYEQCEGSCSVIIQGLECAFSSQEERCSGEKEENNNQGLCKGVSKGNVYINLEIEDEEPLYGEYVFGENTQLCYDLESLELYINDKKFTFAGQEMNIGEDEDAFVTVSGNKITGRDFIYGDIKVESGSISIYPTGIFVHDATNFEYAGLKFRRNWEGFELCFDETNCVKDRNYVLVDKYKQKFSAKAVSGGFPEIDFTKDNPFLTVSETAIFSINSLKESAIEIKQRKDFIPSVELKVFSEKKSGNKPSAILTNGKTRFFAFSDDLWISNSIYENLNEKDVWSTKKYDDPSLSEEDWRISEKEGETIFSSRGINYLKHLNSVPMVLQVLDKNDEDLIGGDESQKIIVTAFDEVAILPADETEGMTDDKVFVLSVTEVSETLSYNTKVYTPKMLEIKFKDKMPNLNIENFNNADLKTLEGVLENLPPALASKIRNVKFIGDYESSTDLEKLCLGRRGLACVDYRGNIYLTRRAINSPLLAHELTHVYQRNLEHNNPDSSKLLERYQDYAEKISVLPRNSEGIEDLVKSGKEVWNEKQKLYVGNSLVKDWMASNEDPIMRSDPTKYCRRFLDSSNVKWSSTWRERPSDKEAPAMGVVRPYGCYSVDEDMATYIEQITLRPMWVGSLVICPLPNIYAKKVFLLKNYGLISSSQYDTMLPPGTQKCIGDYIK